MNRSDDAFRVGIGQEGTLLARFFIDGSGLWEYPHSRNPPFMKKIISSLAVALAVTLSAAADTTVKLTDVHLCCQSCVKGVTKAVSTVDGVKAESSMDDHTVTLTAADTATIQKAVDALTAAGYYGKSSDSAVKVNGDTGAKGEKVTSLKVEDVHLCCGKCVKSVNTALSSVPGVTGNTAEKGAKSFTVTGDFNDKDVMDALQKAGLTGHVAN
jgi:copper chaperone CopZ